MKIADLTGKDFEFETIRQLTEKVTREHYIKVRRVESTINRKEILATIIDAFSVNLGINKVYLTRTASFM